MEYFAYIASSAAAKDGGGIYRCRVGEDGGLTLLGVSPLDCPMYVDFTPKTEDVQCPYPIHPSEMFVVLRDGNGESCPHDPRPQMTSDSSVTFCQLDRDGIPGKFSAMASTEGRAGAHLTVKDNMIFCANYTSGSVSKLEFIDGSYKVVKLSAHTGSGPFVGRQEEPHVHHVIFTPDGRYVCATDLGIDAIVLYDLDLNRVSECRMPARSGPRHLIFSPDGRFGYSVNELDSTVSSLTYESSSGTLTYVRSFDLLPENSSLSYRDQCTGAAIRLTSDGKYLYASSRFDDSISVFAVDGAELTRLQWIPCGGSWPRDINLTPDGKWLYCTNERQNTVTSFAIGSDHLLTKLPSELAVPAPLNVVFA